LVVAVAVIVVIPAFLTVISMPAGRSSYGSLLANAAGTFHLTLAGSTGSASVDMGSADGMLGVSL
jgi:hypothetical protein